MEDQQDEHKKIGYHEWLGRQRAKRAMRSIRSQVRKQHRRASKPPENKPKPERNRPAPLPQPMTPERARQFEVMLGHRARPRNGAK